MKNLNIIILAAGKGTRMKSSLPKIMQPLAGKPMIQHVLDNAIKLKPNKIFVVVNKEFHNQGADFEKNIEIIIQKEQNGTGGAIKSCLSKIRKTKGRVLILYADIPLVRQETLKNIIKLNNNKSINLLTFEKDDFNSYGKVFLDDEGFVSEIIEQKELSVNSQNILCNSGIFCCDIDIIKNLIPKIKNKNKKKEYYLTDIFKFASNNKIRTSITIVDEDEVVGINDKSELANAEYLVQSILREKFMKQGVTIIDPETVYFAEDTKVGKDVIIYPNVFIGNGVTIEHKATIYSFTHLENCKIGKDASVGPYARLRPGTIIEANSKVGNFVEIKKSTIGRGSKISHLSYIGDAEIGSSVNIGAGTITCNYDGKDKHKTIIEDGAFIGSNSSLVAPIKIGKKSYVGSGSAISKNVKPGSLAIERGVQMEINNWERKIKKK